MASTVVLRARAATSQAEEVNPPAMSRPIGQVVRDARRLNDLQVEQVLRHQREHGLRFGDAAVALKLLSRDDVLWALSQQFDYPYASAAGRLAPELVTAHDPFGAQAEAFRELRSQLLLGVLAPDQPRAPLAVVSATAGDGRSYFAANMAVALSQLGKRTLLVDADLRSPRQHTLFELAAPHGLSGVLAGRAEMDVIHQITELPSLYVLAAGAMPPNPLELVQRQAFALLLQELPRRFDHVIVDTPALARGADARVVAARCGSTLLLARRHRSAMPALRRAARELAAGPARLAGVLVNEH